MNLTFRQIEVELIKDRIKLDARDPAKFYYEIRESDWSFAHPRTVEPHVGINFWGTMISPVPLIFPEDMDPYIVLSGLEIKQFMEIFT